MAGKKIKRILRCKLLCEESYSNYLNSSLLLCSIKDREKNKMTGGKNKKRQASNSQNLGSQLLANKSDVSFKACLIATKYSTP